MVTIKEPIPDYEKSGENKRIMWKRQFRIMTLKRP